MDSPSIVPLRSGTDSPPTITRGDKRPIQPSDEPKIVGGDLPGPAVDSPANVGTSAPGRTITRLFCVRHGSTTFNEGLIFMGGHTLRSGEPSALDPPLSQLGQQQVAAQANVMAPVHLDAVYGSGAQRTNLTARAIIGKNVNRDGLRLQVEPDLQSWRCGEWAGRSRADIQKTDPEGYRRWQANDQSFRPPGKDSESLGAYRERIRQTVMQIVQRERGKTVLGAGHGGGLKALYELTRGGAEGDRLKDYPANGSIFEFQFDHTTDQLTFVRAVDTTSGATPSKESESPRPPVSAEAAPAASAPHARHHRSVSEWLNDWHPGGTRSRYQFKVVTTRGEPHVRRRPAP